MPPWAAAPVPGGGRRSHGRLRRCARSRRRVNQPALRVPRSCPRLVTLVRSESSSGPKYRTAGGLESIGLWSNRRVRTRLSHGGSQVSSAPPRGTGRVCGAHVRMDGGWIQGSLGSAPPQFSFGVPPAESAAPARRGRRCVGVGGRPDCFQEPHPARPDPVHGTDDLHPSLCEARPAFG